jgi:hypothetical protein
MNNIIIPSALKKAIIKNNIVLFVGSGTSLTLNMPSWDNLVKNIIDYISEETGNQDLKMFKDILVPGGMNPIDVLTQIEKKGYRKFALDYLGNNLRLKEESDLELHKLLFDLCPRIITTNYDHAFEQALGDGVHVVSNNSKHGISNLSDKKEYIFKIHGDVNDPDNCVLFQSDYEKFYIEKTSQQDLFTTQLKNSILNKTIMFVGFGMNDPYVKEIMDHLYKITEGMMKRHYLFTTNSNFEIPYIEPIILKDYTQLKGEIKKLIEEVSIEKESEIVTEEDIVTNTADELTSTFHMLSSCPIDKDYEVNIDYYLRAFNKYDIDLRINPTNIESIRNCENGYLIFFTKTIKGSLIIEDEYLKSRQITIDELLENVSKSILGIIIFTNDLPFIEDTFKTDIPCLIIQEENQSKIKRKIDLILYKLSNNKIDFITQNERNLSEINFSKIKLNKGIPNIIRNSTKASRYIDKKLLTHFVGRKTDVENIARKIIDLEFQDKLLTIKGSGGIGKTTIIIKTVFELAKRNLFNQIEYISCQSISTYENLHYQISNCLNIDSNINIIESLQSSYNGSKNIVIILDNFETLLQLYEKSKVLDLVSKICDYCIVITTSRQILDLDFEELYELRNLTTEEGIEVFKNYYKGKLNSEDEKILRFDIVEELLNNNPLAIKIISKGTPKSKSLETLKEELQENIFNNENIDKIFENPEDINIEKSNSLFYSIKYSYDQLNPNEKFAFELLSLFPDGIHIENLKKFSKENKNSNNRITDREIKSLDDKSLLESSSGFLKLQSIVNRFSTHQFNNRSESIKKNYFTLCFEYNDFFINFLQKILKTSESLPIQDDNINNYLKCIDFMEYIDKTNLDKLDFVNSLSIFFRNINQHKEFLEKIQKDSFKKLFNENNSEKNLLKIIELQIIYWCIDFDYAINNLRKLFTNEDIQKLNFNNKVDKSSFVKIFNLLTCEGESKNFITELINRWELKINIIDDLFRLGFINISNDLVKYETDFTFGEYDILLENNKLNVEELDIYISSLYKKETLELIQINYLKLKLIPDFKVDTSVFVVTNPYTQGMIFLIEALMENDNDKKQGLFESSLNKLKHIKYYYVEAIFHYCSFLLTNKKNQLFQEQQLIGLNLSKKHSYKYLEYKLNKLLDEDLVYNEDLLYNEFESIDRRTFDLYIEQLFIERKKEFKKYK